MTEELGSTIENMFRTIYESIDVKYLRPIKRQMFKCGYECLDDHRTIKEGEKCVEDCGRTLHQAMTIVQNEITSFQGRIDRCLMDCQDTVRNEKEEEKARRVFDSCAQKCVDKFVPTVPEISKTISDRLEKLQQ